MASMFKGGYPSYRRFCQTQKQLELLMLIRHRYFPTSTTRTTSTTDPWTSFYYALVSIPAPAFHTIKSYMRAPVEMLLKPECFYSPFDQKRDF